MSASAAVRGRESSRSVTTSTHHHGAFPPTPIPMSADIADPIPLAPNAGPDRDLRVQLHTHLEIPLQRGLRDWIGTRRGGITLEAVDHGVEIAFFGYLVGCHHGGTVDSFMEDGIIRIVFLHGAEVIGTLEQMRALATGVLRTYRLAVDALRG